ncbi:MAG: type II toxin-antitoxin system VapC family toxin [Planctomycetes bacterium]|nr:type II toxin-antitoxin system VapC family toxin [Planctomycetota bacterium]
MTTDRILLDTNIVSYILKDSPQANLYVKHLYDKLLTVSFITLGELYYGAEKANWGVRKRNDLDSLLESFVVIPFDTEIARRYGSIVAARRKIGRPISFADGWIAACAIRHDLKLITHNADDFEHIAGQSVISERM